MNSNNPAYLTIDIGSSSVKAAFMDKAGCGDIFTFPLSFTADGKRRWDPQEWLDVLQGIGKLCISKEIASIIISANGPTLVPEDIEGKILEPIIPWENFRGDFLPGRNSFFLPKIAHYKRTHPERYKKVNRFYTAPGWMLFRLTGIFAAPISHEGLTSLYWNDEQINDYGLDDQKLAPFTRLGTVGGGLTSEASAWLNLKEGTPVICGTTDFFMSLIGTGVMNEGMCCDRAGSSEGVNFAARFPFDPIHGKNLRLVPHTMEGLWNWGSVVDYSGRLFEQFRRDVIPEISDYTFIMKRICEYLQNNKAPAYEPLIEGSWEESHAVKHSDWVKAGSAIVNYILGKYTACIDNLTNAGAQLSKIRLCGGQSRNPIWNQMKANASGLILEELENPEAELLGGLCASLYALGEFDSILSASEKIVRVKKQYDPQT